MGKYHNKLDKKYFHKSIYIRKFEEAFNIKIKDYPLQYELVYETYNTILGFNNILFSLNYIPIKNKAENIKHLLNAYLNKYKNKIYKCYDSNCIMIYENLEDSYADIEEAIQLNEEKGTKINLKPFEDYIEQLVRLLEGVNFDKLTDTKDLPYEKKANDKLPKKINFKYINNLPLYECTLFDSSKQEELNNKFNEEYLKRTGINLNEEIEQREFIFNTLNRIKDLNNAIVDYYIYKDDIIVKFFNDDLKEWLKQDNSFVKDITYINTFNKLKEVSASIDKDSIDIAYNKLSELIEQYKNYYERMS